MTRRLHSAGQNRPSNILAILDDFWAFRTFLVTSEMSRHGLSWLRTPLGSPERQDWLNRAFLEVFSDEALQEILGQAEKMHESAAAMAFVNPKLAKGLHGLADEQEEIVRALVSDNPDLDLVILRDAIRAKIEPDVVAWMNTEYA